MSRSMRDFHQYFFGKVHVTNFPDLKDIRLGILDDYAYRINVSDLYRSDIDDAFLQAGVKTFWFPQGEAFGMSLASLYGSLRIMWEAEKSNQALLLHCHSGRNRSVMVADSYFFLRTGKHRQPNEPDLPYAAGKGNQLLLNIDDGQLPGIYRMEEFLSCCKESFADDFPEKERPLDWIKLQMQLAGSGFAGC